MSDCVFDQCFCSFSLWEKTVAACCTSGKVSRETCNFNYDPGQCYSYMVKIYHIATSPEINIYNLYGKCEHDNSSVSGSSTTLSRQHVDKYNLFYNKYTSESGVSTYSYIVKKYKIIFVLESMNMF